MVPTPAPAPGAPKTKTDIVQFPNLPWRLVDEFEAAAMLGMSVKFLRHQRQLNQPPRYRKLNGTTIRYKLSDLEAYVASQPGGGGPDERGKSPRARPR